jgi:hypothetical protein
MSGAFLAFYEKYGGLDAFGYPRTEAFRENGRLEQYTDRFLLLEMPNGQVQTGPLGRLLTAGRTDDAFQVVAFCKDGPALLIAGHCLSGRFLTFWRRHSTLLGPPIAEVTVETNNDGSGRHYQMQWCANGRMEYHPEFAHTRYEVELGLVGKQWLQLRGWLP